MLLYTKILDSTIMKPSFDIEHISILSNVKSRLRGRYLVFVENQAYL